MIQLSLYESCLLVVKANRDNEILLSKQNNCFELMKQQERVSSDKDNDNFTVFYISDIHLEHQIFRAFPNGATDTQVEEFVSQIVSNLLSDEIALYRHNHTILFGGDVASEFSLSKLFFSLFIQTWDKKNKADHKQKREAIRNRNREYKQVKKDLSQWKSDHKWVKTAARDLLEYSDKRVPTAVKELIRKERELFGMIHGADKLEEDYYTKRWQAPSKRVYAVLGNHELWSFDTLEKCTYAYQQLFDELGIAFLNNCGYYIRKKDEPLFFHNEIVIIGGIGFAGYNEWHNADCGLYQNIINREQEIQLTKEWERYYQRIVKKIQDEKALLVVLTHTPPYSWSKKKQLDSNCVYFYGHDHRNTLSFIEETNSFVFADNQIGYTASNIVFKKANIYSKPNPLAYYNEGLHSISPEDYSLFNRFSCIAISGTKLIENYVKNGAKLYMIKENGYYGFFIVCEKKIKGLSTGTFICVGGRLKKLSCTAGIDRYKTMFSNLVNTYLAILSPYRLAQESIAKAVKSFGGEGRIHGYIVDIDFYNHIMLNPEDGKITYYYSPFMGVVDIYNSLRELLSAHNPDCLERYLEQIKLTGNMENNLMPTQGTSHSGLIQIDIKNSPYADSRKMNQLQRLFDAKVLRYWDDSLPIVSHEDISLKDSRLIE